MTRSKSCSQRSGVSLVSMVVACCSSMIDQSLSRLLRPQQALYFQPEQACMADVGDRWGSLTHCRDLRATAFAGDVGYRTAPDPELVTDYLFYRSEAR
jgi:hypothetical protein